MTRRRQRPNATGFTLIELILVLTMLSIVLALAAPSLSSFFRGRTLDSEGRRFLALTRYGQSRAVSEGVPMILWVDVPQRAYGLETESSYTDTDPRAVTFTVAEELTIEVATAVSTRPAVPAAAQASGRNARPAIRFEPDGSLGEASLAQVIFREGDKAVLWLGQSHNRLSYAIQTNPLPAFRR